MLILHDVPPTEVDALDSLLQFLKSRRGIISPEQAEERLAAEGPRRRGQIPVLLTFDDGFRSNLDVARGVLEAHAVRALFFVCPGLVDTPGSEQRQSVETFVFPALPPPPAERLALMSWDEIRELTSRGHTIGSHSLMHRRLSALSESDLNQDISHSFVRLREELGVSPKWFAYPFGDLRSTSPAVLATASRHFQYVCSGLRGLNTPATSRLALLRESIDLAAPFHYIRMVADGGLDLLYRLRARSLSAMASEVLRAL
ncbi:MAG TPA: polysaccharide deacetylase family protein [Thermoanaerobaculia bacterium]|nr:polysaccharide deacetylase family protein [Thermoanaerobaculia bacterium]